MEYPGVNNLFLSDHANLLIASYRQSVGCPLLPGSEDMAAQAERLFYAPFAVVSHNADQDPIFNYANLTALELFGYLWEEFIQLPSRLSAEPNDQVERAKLLAEVAKQGFSTGYSGVRLSKMGLRFIIKDATVWNVSDTVGKPAGQAACIRDWQFL